MSLKIVCLSDSHNLHDQITLPDGDVLVHAGDSTMLGRIDELENFVNWFGRQPHKYKVFIAGNHDFGMETDQKNYEKFFYRRGLPVGDVNSIRTYIEGLCKTYNITYLNNTSTIIEGLKFYGSPDQPAFCGWGFNRTNAQLTEIWNKIPDDVNVLITHAPSYGVLDSLEYCGTMVGDVPLMKRINTLPNLKLHVFGHIHCSHGYVEIDGIKRVNACILNERYRVEYDPIVVEI